MMNMSKKVLSIPVKNLSTSEKIEVSLINSCCGILQSLCKSLKSQDDLW